MANTDPFQIIAAVPTPFDEAGAISYPTYQRLLAHVQPWVDGVLVAGTTAEFVTLTDDERLELTERTLATFGPQRTIVHIGSASLHQVLRLADAARRVGARRFAALTPYYFPYSLDEVTTFFLQLRDRLADTELFGYFFAERTGIRLTGTEVGDIARRAALDGIKISGDVWRDLPALRATAGDALPVLTGYDLDPLAVRRLGASGVVSGLSCIQPQLYHQLALGDDDPTSLTVQTQQLGERAGGSIHMLKAALAAVVPGEWSQRIPGASHTAGQVPSLQRNDRR